MIDPCCLLCQTWMSFGRSKWCSSSFQLLLPNEHMSNANVGSQSTSTSTPLTNSTHTMTTKHWHCHWPVGLQTIQHSVESHIVVHTVVNTPILLHTKWLYIQKTSLNWFLNQLRPRPVKTGLVTTEKLRSMTVDWSLVVRSGLLQFRDLWGLVLVLVQASQRQKTRLDRTFRHYSQHCLLIFGSLPEVPGLCHPFLALWQTFLGCRNHVKNVPETFFEFIVAVLTVIIIFASIYRTDKLRILKMATFGGQKSQNSLSAVSLVHGTSPPPGFFASLWILWALAAGSPPNLPLWWSTCKSEQISICTY